MTTSLWRPRPNTGDMHSDRGECADKTLPLPAPNLLKKTLVTLGAVEKTLCSPELLLRSDSKNYLYKELVRFGARHWAEHFTGIVSLILITILLSRGSPLHFMDVATVSKY